VRTYEQTHPWLSFSATAVNDLPPRTWMLLGEARSKCDHLSGAPLRPALADELALVTLSKGAQATTAIEGNTLTLEQVRGILDGTFKAPGSRAYQETEVRNVLDALTELADNARQASGAGLTPEKIRSLNALVLRGMESELDPSTVPGQFRTHSVVVGRYPGAPAEDVPYLVDQLCSWLDGSDFVSPDDEISFALVMVKSALAHLYLAWIHPFGDGNGRTARLVEFLILARSGRVPIPAANLLSNHYNLTRDRYYRELDRASRSGGDIKSFLAYAIEGFVDGIREQIDEVQGHQLQVAWENYVTEVLDELPTSKANDRQREVVMALTDVVAASRARIATLTPSLAAQYAATGGRTLARDVNRLLDLGLIERAGSGHSYRAAISQMRAFLLPIAPRAEQ
jgi:Fic family protein